MTPSIKISAALLFLALVATSVALEKLPLAVIVTYLIASSITFAAYARDKSAARRNTWRVKERTLHLLSLCCGWPGALIAQQYLRHKSQKISFRVVLVGTILINTGLFLGLFTAQGQRFVEQVSQYL